MKAMRKRERGIISTILEHANKGRKVMVVTGALHAAKIYAELKGRGIPVEIVDTGIIPRDAAEDAYNKARGQIYSEGILRKLRSGA